jgi:hypothetical protein
VPRSSILKSNFVDSTTFHAVESLFREGARDPWAASLAGGLADLFVYSDTIRYPVPARRPGAGYDLAQEDSLLRDLARRDSQVFAGEEYSIARPRMIAERWLSTSFQRFSEWAGANELSLRHWITLHHSQWVRNRVAAALGERYVFNLDDLLRSPEVGRLASTTGVHAKDLCYAFDSVLRYPIFGELAGPNGYYLNHRLRNAVLLPTMRRQNAKPPTVAVSFSGTVGQLAPRLSRDGYTSLLHELRGAVRNSGLHQMLPGDFDQERIREIAANVALPPRLRGYTRGLGIAGGIFGGLGAIPLFGQPAALIGGAVSIAAAFWSGGLPRSMARIKWLRWALKWDVEEQAERRS